VTVSAGVAEGSADEIDTGTLLRRVDDALYAAKRAGRDCVHVAGEQDRQPMAV